MKAILADSAIAKSQPTAPWAGRSGDFERILGIRFFRGTPDDAVKYFSSCGGLLVIPASPALTKLRHDQAYRLALQQADMALLDSYLAALAWKALSGRSMTKVSGSTYLKCLLHSEDFRNESDVLWIVSSDDMRGQAAAWLDDHGFAGPKQRFYVAPANQISENHDLLLLIEEQKPHHIIIATTDGTQEKLGLYLRDYLLFRSRIHCVGAALAFLTGAERLPEWTESARLSWLYRLICQPRMILPRIAIAFVLLQMLVRYRSEEPALRPRWADV